MKTCALLFLCALAAQAAPPELREGPNGHSFVLVPAGTYAVGSENGARNPPRQVELGAFAIADAETTNAQFDVFVSATKYLTDAERRGFGKVSREGMPDWAWDDVPGADWRHPYGPDGPSWEDLREHPVTQISGADAAAYSRWLGGRLPSLDEWEVAARAGAETRYPWGDDFDAKKANIWNGLSHRKNTREDGHLFTAPVRSFPANAWGLHDVIGNVFEYGAGLPEGVAEQDRDRLVAGRGGSWWCSVGTCDFYNLADIGMMDRHGSLANQGFRAAFDPAQLGR